MVNGGSNTVTKINTVTNTVTTTIKVGTNPSGIAFDGKYAYVTNKGSDSVSVITLSATMSPPLPAWVIHRPASPWAAARPM